MARLRESGIADRRGRKVLVLIPQAQIRGEPVGSPPLVFDVEVVVVDPSIQGGVPEGLGEDFQFLAPVVFPE